MNEVVVALDATTGKEIWRADFPQLQYESGWILTNIASGESKHTQVVIDKGGVSALIYMLKSNVEEVVEQGIWALGNIGGDSSMGRVGIFGELPIVLLTPLPLATLALVAISLLLRNPWLCGLSCLIIPLMLIWEAIGSVVDDNYFMSLEAGCRGQRGASACASGFDRSGGASREGARQQRH